MKKEKIMQMIQAYDCLLYTSECTMCGKYCAMKIVEKYLRAE